MLELDAGVAILSISRDASVRLRAAAGRALPPDPAEAIGRLPWRASSAEPFAREDGGLVLAFDGPEGEVRVEVDAQPFAVRVLDRAGAPLARLVGLELGPECAARATLAEEPERRFFGFGEKSGRLDKRGCVLRMRNRDANLALERDPLYVSIPFFLAFGPDPHAPRACGVLLDVLAPSRFDVARSDPGRVVIETQAGGLDLGFFPGPLPRDVLRRFGARVGRTPLPPLWALGHHQSRWSYRSAAEVRALAAEIRRRGIPTDAIHLDIDHMDGYRVFTWDRRRFPDPKGLLAELAQQGFRVVTIVDPGLKVDPGYEVFADARHRDLLMRNADGSLCTLRVWPGRAALPDFNRPEVRSWWGEQHRPLLDVGVAGIWNDMNEPAGWASDLRIGRLMLPTRPQDLSRAMQADPAQPERRVPHEEVRNLYGQQECRATREFLEAARPERRAFVLSRSGFAGIQRYAAIWTGDSRSRWSHLRLSIPMLLNLSLSGVAFCGADIGGFAFNCTPELYARWIQIGALYPFARTHSMFLKRRQEPWRFGPRVEAIARAALERRMRLLPYLYGLFREAEETSAPVWRPLFYEFPNDAASADVEDQVMLGPALLVAPVLERGARERELYLPPGVWFDLHDDARHLGPKRLRVPAPLERLPLFARGGRVIPARSPVRHAGETPVEPLVLEVFPGGDSETELFEDDGETLAYREGAWARTPLRLWTRAGGRLRLELGAREGAFPVAPRPVRVVVHGAGTPRSVLLDARPLEEASATPGYLSAEGRVTVVFRDDGRARALELEPAP